MLAQVIGEDGHITIPHFYDDVEEVPAAEREMIAQIPFDEKKYMEAIGVKALKGEKGNTTPNFMYNEHATWTSDLSLIHISGSTSSAM